LVIVLVSFRACAPAWFFFSSPQGNLSVLVG
jgi:hypothetical protein